MDMINARGGKFLIKEE